MSVFEIKVMSAKNEKTQVNSYPLTWSDLWCRTLQLQLNLITHPLRLLLFFFCLKKLFSVAEYYCQRGMLANWWKSFSNCCRSLFVFLWSHDYNAEEKLFNFTPLSFYSQGDVFTQGLWMSPIVNKPFSSSFFYN